VSAKGGCAPADDSDSSDDESSEADTSVDLSDDEELDREWEAMSAGDSTSGNSVLQLVPEGLLLF
jgi:hypothetical protein